MANTATVQAAINGMYITTYGRAADNSGYAYWCAQVGVSTADAASSIATDAQFTTLASQFVGTQSTYFDATYGLTSSSGAALSDTAFIQALYNNLGSANGDTAGVLFWLAKLSGGETRTQMVGEFVNGFLNVDLNTKPLGMTDAEYATALTRQHAFENKILVSEDYASKTASGLIPLTTTDAAFLASMRAINGVTSDDSTRDAAIAQVDAAGAANNPALITTGGGGTSGQTFTLTTGVDALPGMLGSLGTTSTAGNDIISGVITGVAATTTLNVFDAINGGLGTNTLNVNYAGSTATFDASTIPTLTNIQVANVSGMIGNGPSTFDGSIAPSLTTLNFSAPVAVAGAGSMTVTNASALLSTYGISNIARTDYDFSITSAAGVHAGSADAVTLNLSSVKGATSATADGPRVDFFGFAAGQGIETVNVVATGTDILERLTVEDGAAAQTMTALNISGAGSLQIGTALNFKGTTGTIDASTNTGGVTLTVGTEDITFTGGTGNDRLNFAAAGDLDSADVISFGDGTDTLGLADTTIAASLYTAINATGAERIAFTAGITADASKLTAHTFVVDNDIAGNTFTKLEATDTVEVSTAANGTATVNLTASLGFNTANVKLAGTAGDIANLASLDTTGQANVNIESVGTFGANITGAITNATNSILTITGSGSGLTIASLSNSASVTATGYSGVLTITGANAASSITGGSGDDVITGGTAAGGDTLKGGIGDDTINTGAVTGTTAVAITGGTGADAINIQGVSAAAHVATVNATAAESFATAGHFDTVTFSNGTAVGSQTVTLVTGVLSTSVTGATSVTIGTTTVTAGGFLAVGSASSTLTTTDQNFDIYQDSNGNGVIEATDLHVAFTDGGAADTMAITIVGSQLVVTDTFV